MSKGLGENPHQRFGASADLGVVMAGQLFQHVVDDFRVIVFDEFRPRRFVVGLI